MLDDRYKVLISPPYFYNRGVEAVAYRDVFCQPAWTSEEKIRQIQFAHRAGRVAIHNDDFGAIVSMLSPGTSIRKTGSELKWFIHPGKADRDFTPLEVAIEQLGAIDADEAQDWKEYFQEYLERLGPVDVNAVNTRPPYPIETIRVGTFTTNEGAEYHAVMVYRGYKFIQVVAPGGHTFVYCKAFPVDTQIYTTGRFKDFDPELRVGTLRLLDTEYMENLWTMVTKTYGQKMFAFEMVRVMKDDMGIPT